MEDELICNKCDTRVKDENDLFDYEDLLVCEYCLDELRILDEKGYQDDVQDYD